MQQMFLASIEGLAATLPASINAQAKGAEAATVELTVRNDGTWEVSVSPGGSGADSGTWLTGSGVPGNYAVRLTQDSGTTPTGSSVNTSLNLGTTRTWTLSVSGSGSVAFNGSLTVRRNDDDTVLDTSDPVDLAATIV